MCLSLFTAHQLHHKNIMPRQGQFGQLMHIPRPARRSTRLQTRATLAEPKNRFMHLEGLMQIRINKELQMEEDNEERDEQLDSIDNNVTRLQEIIAEQQIRLDTVEQKNASLEIKIANLEAVLNVVVDHIRRNNRRN